MNRTWQENSKSSPGNRFPQEPQIPPTGETSSGGNPLTVGLHKVETGITQEISKMGKSRTYASVTTAYGEFRGLCARGKKDNYQDGRGHGDEGGCLRGKGEQGICQEYYDAYQFVGGGFGTYGTKAVPKRMGN